VKKTKLTLGDLVLSLLVINGIGGFGKKLITFNTNIENLGVNNTKLEDLVENSY
jgi:hypothetical protein